MAQRAIQRRASARAAIARDLREEWDLSGWNTYVVSGRVLPERCMVQVPEISTKGKSGNIRFVATASIVHSHLSCLCKSDVPLSSFQLSDIVKNIAFFPTDYVAFVNRAFYEIILDTWRSAETGEVHTFPVYEPFLEPAPEGYLFRPGEVDFDIPWGHADDALKTALHDLGQALRFSRRTLEYCRMALEAVRHHFDPVEEKDWRRRWKRGERAMCAALRISQDRYRRLERDAAPGRHGEPLHDLNWELRSGALQLGWEVAYRFRLYLDGTPNDDWAEIV